MAATKIIKRISGREFKKLLCKVHNDIRISQHAYFRLSEAQRKIYKAEYLVYAMLKEAPVLVGVQENGRYAVFFRRRASYLRIIFRISNYVEIITFFIVNNVPRI